jgi:hypothetical protein
MQIKTTTLTLHTAQGRGLPLIKQTATNAGKDAREGPVYTRVGNCKFVQPFGN